MKEKAKKDRKVEKQYRIQQQLFDDIINNNYNVRQNMRYLDEQSVPVDLMNIGNIYNGILADPDNYYFTLPNEEERNKYKIIKDVMEHVDQYKKIQEYNAQHPNQSQIYDSLPVPSDMKKDEYEQLANKIKKEVSKGVPKQELDKIWDDKNNVLKTIDTWEEEADPNTPGINATEINRPIRARNILRALNLTNNAKNWVLDKSSLNDLYDGLTSLETYKSFAPNASGIGRVLNDKNGDKYFTENVLGSLIESPIWMGLESEQLPTISQTLKNIIGNNKKIIADGERKMEEFLSDIKLKTIFETAINNDPYLKNADPLLLMNAFRSLVNTSYLAAQDPNFVIDYLRKVVSVGSPAIDSTSYNMLTKLNNMLKVQNNPQLARRLFEKTLLEDK